MKKLENVILSKAALPVKVGKAVATKVLVASKKTKVPSVNTIAESPSKILKTKQAVKKTIGTPVGKSVKKASLVSIPAVKKVSKKIVVVEPVAEAPKPLVKKKVPDAPPSVLIVAVKRQAKSVPEKKKVTVKDISKSVAKATVKAKLKKVAKK